jgi:hypothetical protein
MEATSPKGRGKTAFPVPQGYLLSKKNYRPVANFLQSDGVCFVYCGAIRVYPKGFTSKLPSGRCQPTKRLTRKILLTQNFLQPFRLQSFTSQPLPVLR